jgi:ElaB/YqjD/DUF883 family membrane-anchored ribosome-binding protein
MRKNSILENYETPDALRHDLQTLTENARTLFEATAEIADEKIKIARRKLQETLHGAGESCSRWRERAVVGAQAADKAVRTHPYATVGVALGVGVLIGYLVSRRD